jgi:hypothetical protein
MPRHIHFIGGLLATLTIAAFFLIPCAIWLWSACHQRHRIVRSPLAVAAVSPGIADRPVSSV